MKWILCSIVFEIELLERPKITINLRIKIKRFIHGIRQGNSTRRAQINTNSRVSSKISFRKILKFSSALCLKRVYDRVQYACTDEILEQDKLHQYRKRSYLSE